jgi:hypothetical protein
MAVLPGPPMLGVYGSLVAGGDTVWGTLRAGVFPCARGWLIAAGVGGRLDDVFDNAEYGYWTIELEATGPPDETWDIPTWRIVGGYASAWNYDW